MTYYILRRRRPNSKRYDVILRCYLKPSDTVLKIFEAEPQDKRRLFRAFKDAYAKETAAERVARKRMTEADHKAKRRKQLAAAFITWAEENGIV